MLRRYAKGFSLIELLMVIAIIVLIAALLLPSLSRMQSMAESLECRSNFKQLGTAALLFAGDHQGFLTASISTGRYQGTEAWQSGWMGNEVLPQGMNPPRHWYTKQGLLAQYLGNKAAGELYRCPSHRDGVFGTGEGRNRMHDYSMISAFTGAKVSQLPKKTSILIPGIGAGKLITVPCPLYLEESPAHGLNARFIDPDHTSINRLGTWHYDYSGNYFATDGSVQRLMYGDPVGPRCYEWTNVRTPSGRLVNLGQVSGLAGGNRLYGNWNRL